MADGRMLKKVISTSRKLSELKTDTARLLYTWLIPHLDIDGRFYANSILVGSLIFPRLNKNPKDIEECLKDLEKVGLIILYESGGDRYLEFTKFREHQQLRTDREAKSIIPPFTPGELQDNSRRSKDKISKDKISKDKIIYDSSKNEKKLYYLFNGEYLLVSEINGVLKVRHGQDDFRTYNDKRSKLLSLTKEELKDLKNKL